MNKPLENKLELLNTLNENTDPLWGKMTAQHMIEHLIGAFQMSIDELKVECFNPPDKLPVLQKILMSTRPLPKNFVNPVIGADLKPLQYSNLVESISVLKNYVDQYYLFYEKNPDAKPTNPTFGPLNREQWDAFHEKHMTHHLSQFGLIPEQ